jgi:hypothetical protein
MIPKIPENQNPPKSRVLQSVFTLLSFLYLHIAIFTKSINSMATAYVKNPDIRFYRSPYQNSEEASYITRHRMVAPHYLRNFSEGDTLGALTTKKSGAYVQLIYEFDIRIKGWTGIQSWQKHTETLWVKEADITTDSPQTTAKKVEAVKEQKREEIRKQILEDTDPKKTTASGNGSSSGSAIGGVIALIVVGIVGLLVWAFRKRKPDERPPVAASPPPKPVATIAPKKQSANLIPQIQP